MRKRWFFMPPTIAASLADRELRYTGAMSLFDGIREAVAETAAIGRISGGLVPLPSHIASEGSAGNGLIVNCEFIGDWEATSAAELLQRSRSDALAVLRVIAATSPGDVSSVALRLGLYNGDQLRETLYCCNLPFSFLAKAQSKGDFTYWNTAFDVIYPIEYSSIAAISELLKK
jgi:hypothetical protein